MALKVYLIRHGETDFVKSGKVWGQNDEESLNKAGKKQIEKLAGRLERINFDKFFTSDLKRTKETAEIIKNIVGVSYVEDERLREYNPGSISPNSKEWIEEYKKILATGKSKYEIRPFDGENIWDVIKRATSFIKALEKEEGNILIASHAGFNSIFMNLLQGLNKDSFNKIKQDSSCLNIIELRNAKWMFEIINDTAHLEDKK